MCQCCACTNHTGQASDPPITVVTTALGSTLPIADHPLKEIEDPEARVRDDPATSCDSKRDDSDVNILEYPDSEIDDWNWDELEASPSKSVTIPTHSQNNTFLHNSLGEPDAHCRHRES